MPHPPKLLPKQRRYRQLQLQNLAGEMLQAFSPSYFEDTKDVLELTIADTTYTFCSKKNWCNFHKESDVLPLEKLNKILKPLGFVLVKVYIQYARDERPTRKEVRNLRK